MALVNVFVTVGTTKFDKMISTVTTTQALRILKKRGCTNLVLQVGHGKMPKNERREGITITSFGIKSSIDEEINNADFIISHGGAGSCFAALNAKIPVLVVINEDLMDNHQEELATKLHEGKHVLKCNCQSLISVLENMKFDSLLTFPRGNAFNYAQFIDRVMGF